MPDARPDGRSDAVKLDFVDRVYTPKPAMELGIQLYLAGLSLRNTVTILWKFGVDRCRATVHNWIQKADLEPRVARQPDKIALDETVIKIDGERFWFFAAVEPETNKFPHVGLYVHRTEDRDPDVSSGASGQARDQGRRLLRRWSAMVAGQPPRTRHAFPTRNPWRSKTRLNVRLRR